MKRLCLVLGLVFVVSIAGVVPASADTTTAEPPVPCEAILGDPLCDLLSEVGGWPAYYVQFVRDRVVGVYDYATATVRCYLSGECWPLVIDPPPQP